MIHRARLAWICLLLLAGCGRATDTTPRSPPGFSFSQGAGKSALEVTNLAAQDLSALMTWPPDSAKWPALLSVSIQSPVNTERPAIVGTYRVAGNVLRFEPRFPFDPELKYLVRLSPAQLPATGRAEAPTILYGPPQEIASRLGATTKVTAVYPSADTLPENQLRFYLHFSAPMSRGEAYSRVHLLKAAGQVVEDAFLELGEELWNQDQTRFTLFIEPGRIKQGLKPREELGPVLEAGKSYTLLIDQDWRDAAGHPLEAEYRKTFRTTTADEQSADPKQWKVEAPAAGRTQPLVVTFPEPLDHALLLRLLSVVDAAGKTIEGTPRTAANETRWEFAPGKPWSAGAYRLVAATTLEDLAGNSLARQFEVDMFHPVTEQVPNETVSLPFEVR